MKLLAISDLHVGFRDNRTAIEEIREHPDDWLIVAGDVGETPDQLEWTWKILTARFPKIIWVPGNHELWTTAKTGPRGVAKYEQLVALCRSHGVVTPEDPYPVWPGSPDPCTIAPLFLLYDYSFRPDDIPQDGALAWAKEDDLVCSDELLLDPDPYPTRSAWCAARCEQTAVRLAAIPENHRTVLVNHFPLRYEFAWLPAIPRFSIWCGTRLTHDWHTRFRAVAAVSGHLHFRTSRWRDGVHFQEVSLGYPRHWRKTNGIESYLHQVLPAPAR